MLLLGFWFALAGVLLIGVVLTATRFKRLPFTTAQLYLGVGVLLGAAGLLPVDLIDDARLVERASEIAVIVSLFVAGLKLRLPLADLRWRAPLRLATVSMVVTVGAITLAGVYGLGLTWGAAVLLGALLAPTDPVLAAEVQVRHADDRDRLRVALTGEAGLNDGTAFPFVMLGLGLLGLHELGPFGLHWLARDVAWATAAGLGVGAVAGTLVARLVLYLRRNHGEAIGLDDFLALGVLALAYGAALLLHGYGFLAAFAAGVALRRVERRENDGRSVSELEAEVRVAAADLPDASEERARDTVATAAEHAPTYLAAEALRFNEQLERLGELALVVIAGAALASTGVPPAALWFVPLLFVVIRPAGVLIGLAGARLGRADRRRVAWFGMRGIGSLYYLAFAVGHGFGGPDARLVTGLVLAVVAASVLVHGVTAYLTLGRDP